MTDYTAWLGPAADDMTPDQRAAFNRAADRINANYADPDDSAEASAAMSAACQVILGDAALADLGRKLADARRIAHEAMSALTGGIIGTVEASPYTLSEVELAGQAQVARMTVRKALGK